jgi:hypothetical protein
MSRWILIQRRPAGTKIPQGFKIWRGYLEQRPRETKIWRGNLGDP